MDTEFVEQEHAQEPDAKPITRLCALDSLFAASGTVDVKVTRVANGRRVEQKITLPIKSVDNELAESLARPFRPKVPTRRESKNGTWFTIVDEANQEYQDKLSEYNRLNSYVIAFLALDVDICDDSGRVVWSADNGIHDIQAARAAVKKMGLVDNQLVDILKAVRQLTAEVEEAQTSD
jgi:hypothetical protein